MEKRGAGEAGLTRVAREGKLEHGHTVVWQDTGLHGSLSLTDTSLPPRTHVDSADSRLTGRLQQTRACLRVMTNSRFGAGRGEATDSSAVVEGLDWSQEKEVSMSWNRTDLSRGRKEFVLEAGVAHLKLQL